MEQDIITTLRSRSKFNAIVSLIRWKELTGGDVKFESDLLISTVTYPLAKITSRQTEKENDEREFVSYPELAFIGFTQKSHG